MSIQCSSGIVNNNQVVTEFIVLIDRYWAFSNIKGFACLLMAFRKPSELSFCADPHNVTTNKPEKVILTLLASRSIASLRRINTHHPQIFNLIRLLIPTGAGIAQSV